MWLLLPLASQAIAPHWWKSTCYSKNFIAKEKFIFNFQNLKKSLQLVCLGLAMFSYIWSLTVHLQAVWSRWTQLEKSEGRACSVTNIKKGERNPHGSCFSVQQSNPMFVYICRHSQVYKSAVVCYQHTSSLGWSL